MAGGGPYDEHRWRLCPCRLRPLVEKEDGLHGSNVQTWWEAGGAASRAGRRAPQKAHGPSGSREPVETVGWAGEQARPGGHTETPAWTLGSSVCWSSSFSRATGPRAPSARQTPCSAGDAKANATGALSTCHSRETWTETPKRRMTDSGWSSVVELQAPRKKKERHLK